MHEQPIARVGHKESGAEISTTGQLTTPDWRCLKSIRIVPMGATLHTNSMTFRLSRQPFSFDDPLNGGQKQERSPLVMRFDNPGMSAPGRRVPAFAETTEFFGNRLD